jgi:glycosyltransferase involved in cell wall biosynthesis
MDKEYPLVSVIIPTYNNGHLIEKALKSIIDQSYKRWEIIIVDNYSTDNTKSIIEEYKKDVRIQFFQINNEGIVAKSRNLGIKKATGEYIAFLDSDDWWSPSKLEESLNVLQNGYDLVYHDLWIAKKSDQQVFWRKAKTRVLKKTVTENLLKNGNGINNSSVVVKKSILEQIGLLTEEKEFIAWEDYDCWVRISMITDRFFRLDKCLGYYWLGGGNLSSTNRTIVTMNSIKKKYENLFRLYNLMPEDRFPWWIEYNLLSNEKNDLAILILKIFSFIFLYKNLIFIKIFIKKILNKLK